MSDKPKTAGEWLALGDELGVELAKVLTPGGRTHGHVLSPDRIVLDWNTAMEWRDKICNEDQYYEFIGALEAMWRLGDGEKSFDQWLLWVNHAQPKHYLIAAALSKGAKT